MPQPLVFARDKNSLANRTEATFLIDNGNRHTEITSPLTRTLNTTILQLFLRVQKRAIYTWMAHVECTETLDWQLEVDKKYVFFSKDFLPRQEHAGKKMKHYPEVFTQQSVLRFKPMLLVRLELVTHGFQNINYDSYMCDIMLNQPALLQQWKHKIQRLKQKREELHAPMRDKVHKENKEITWRMIEPGFEHYLTAIETMSGFDKDGDIVCVSSRRKQYAWNSIAQLFVTCSNLAQKNGLDKFTKHADWQIRINGLHSFDEVDYRDCEPGCLPAVMVDYPTVFTPRFTIEMRPVFLVHHSDEMQELGCTNLLHFVDEKWIALEKQKMQQFVFAQFSIFPKDMANASLHPDINKLIFDEVVRPNNRPAAASYYSLR